MLITDTTPRYSRKRFIKTHLLVMLLVGLFGYVSGIDGSILEAVVLIAVAAPLALIPGARLPDVITCVLSSVLALLFVVGMVFLYVVLLFVHGYLQPGGRWN